eukprot:CAMPEP_0179490734 /NCGR_PEP_ID=MMETSP0799-20121207/65642_1 /TAXON_ID=46947 /ORGANISM="Geminigera cryophila, Strain CCMP2564" /LENGTH=63 /DNA_ID=CAMNT_0021306997 /DNA_START=48 /DNA_END=236 /DNA_ORIENTATION=-
MQGRRGKEDVDQTSAQARRNHGVGAVSIEAEATDRQPVVPGPSGRISRFPRPPGALDINLGVH